MAAVSQRVQSSAASNSGQSSSASVLEFVCLFSRDLRKKQKRWQDGRIKYHAFNKRVMVYDERGNFVGDTHWRKDYDFEEGEELELERGGVIVQTAECVGSRTQDLSELIDKRAQEKAQRQSAAAARHSSPLAPSSARPPHATSGYLQLHSRPLHSVGDTPTGHYGRAVVPSESPYEQRQRQSTEQADPHDGGSPRPAKRRKRDIEPPNKNGYAQNLFGATLSLSAVPMSSAPVRHQPRKALLTSGSYSFPKPSSPRDGDNEVKERQPNPSDTSIHRPKSRPLTESTTSPNIPRPAVKIPKPMHAAQKKAREPPPLARGNSREDPIAIDLASSQEEICDTSKQTRNIAENNAKQRPISTFSMQSKPKTKEPRREAPNDKALDDPFYPHLPASSRTEKIVQATGKSTAEDQTAGHRRLAIDEPSTSLGSSKGLLAGSTESLQNTQETVGNPEARIELRVKSRKKRGLLMMSEKSVPKKPRNSNNPKSAIGLSCLTGFEGKVEAPLLEAPRQIPGTRKVTGPGKPGKEASNDGPFNAESFGDVSADERCYTSDEPFEVMSIVGQVKGQLPGARQGLEKGGLEVKARIAVDQDSDESHIDYAPRVIRIASSEPEEPFISKEKRSSIRATAYKDEKAPPPRLVRLSRKGIRSKEVIGLTFDDDEDNDPVRFSPADIQGFNDTKARQKSKAREDTPSDTLGCQEQNNRSASPIGASGQQPTPQTHEAGTVSSIGANRPHALPAGGLGRRGLHSSLPGPREEPPNTCELPPMAEADNVPRVEPKGKTASNCGTAMGPAASNDVFTPKEPARGKEGQPRSRPDARTDEPHPGQLQHTTVVQEAPLTDIETAASQLLPRAQPIPRLANPATRGRKAAKASDAAGKMPEAILPAEPPSLLGRQQPSRMPVSNSENGGKPKLELPGFSKATGGPWSREAHDLFEFTRPQDQAA